MAMSMSVPIFELLCEVLNVAKKASSIARLIRDERSGMFQKLVEEKTGDSKNLRFAQDYKTLADVIIQETIRKDLGEKFPPILENILGEESNKFTNSLGELVTVSVLPALEETRDHLETVLAGNRKLATRLAEVIHSADDLVDMAGNSSPSSFSQREDVLPYSSRLSAPIPLQSLGIWVDPIDSTAEYIKGVDGAKFQHHGILVKGLQSAVILIGIFDRVTGEPVLGVIYQPFGGKRDAVTDSCDAEDRVDGIGSDRNGENESADVDPDRTPQSAGDMDGLLFGSEPKEKEDHEEGDNDAAHSCWQERYTWGVCYGDIKLYSTGGTPLPNNSSSFSPHSSFSFHSFPGGGGGLGNGSKGSQDFSSASSLLPSSSQLNYTSHDNRNHSHHSTPVCNDNDQKPNSSSSAPPLSSPSASLGATPGISPFGASGVNPVGTKLLLIGGAEGSRDSSLLLPFRKEFTVVRAAGAGYKLLCLCDDLAHAYLLTKPTTYRWDTCAPHAILKAKGGNVYNWQKLSEKCKQFVAGGGGGGGSKELLKEMVQEYGNSLELKYHLEETGEQGAQRFKNSGGVLAVSGSAGLASVLRPLLESSRSQSELSQSSQRMRSQSQLSSQSQKSTSQPSQKNQRQSLSQLSQISSSQPSQQNHQLRSQSQLSQMSTSQPNQQVPQQRSQSQLSQISRPSSDKGSVSHLRQSPLCNSITSPISDASSSSIIDGFARRNQEETSSKSAAVARQLDVMIDMGDLLLPEKSDPDVALSQNSLNTAEEQETSLIIGKL